MRGLHVQDLYARGGRRFWDNLAVSLHNPEGIAEALATSLTRYWSHDTADVFWPSTS